MPLEVIGAGFGRTGTSSLQAALEKLGFGPCDHMKDVFRDAEHARLWDAATRGETVDWHQVFAGYRSTVDWPGCAVYEQLMDQYPEAKVLLSVRDADRWYESVRNTIYRLCKPALPLMVFYPVVMLTPRLRTAIRLARRLILEETFQGNFADRAHAVDVFERHNQDVIERVPAEKLLVYEVKDGWEPLCEFLGVDVPDTPFPHINETSRFRRVVRWISAVEMSIGAVGIGLALRRVRRRPR